MATVMNQYGYIGLITNIQSSNSGNNYMFLISPVTQAWVIYKNTSGIYLSLASGTNTAISMNGLNKFKIERTPSTGQTSFYINNVLLNSALSDSTYSGGVSELVYFSNYTETGKVQFGSFTVSTFP
jgi:hypothetical protein